ncbi:MAG: hypothetical protein ABI769_15300 [Pseudomonadota bacterium]
MNASLSSTRLRPSIVIPLALLMAAIAVVGFWHTYFGALFAGHSQAQWLFHVHAAIFMGWIGLVMLQAWLAMSGRTALHVKVGRLGMIYGAALIVFGLTFSLIVLSQRIAAIGVDGVKGQFLVPLTDMGTFSIFLIGAWHTRKRPESHRRFILLATNTLLIAAVGRLFGGTASIALRDVIPFLLVWLSPLWIAMTYDGLRHRMMHPVYAWGAVLLIVLRYRQLLRETDTWMSISHWIAERLV